MSRRSRGLTIAGIAVLAGVAALVLLRGTGPTVRGEPFRRWFTGPGDPAAEMRRVLAETGPGALPELVRLRDWREPVWNPWIRRAAARAPAPVDAWLGAVARRDAASVRPDALRGIRLFGPEARGELTWLLPLTADPAQPLAAVALEAVLAIDPDSPATREAALRWLTDPGPAVRRRGLRALHTARARIPGSAEALRALLHEDVVSVELALLALARLGPGAAPAAPEVLARLGDPVHGEAAERALAAMGPEVLRPLLPEVYRRCLTLFPPPFRLLAAAGTHAAPARGIAAAYLADRDPMVRVLAVWADASMQGDRAAAVPGLLAVLADPGADSPVTYPLSGGPFDFQGWQLALGPRQTAAWLLGELGPDAAPARAVLGGLLDEPDFLLSLLAARALARQGASREATLGAIRRGLASPDAQARSLAAVVARELGPDARELRPALESALRTDMLTRGLALGTLGALGEDGP